MNKKGIKSLIDKYFEGLTSLKEEQILRDYFQKEEIPEEWEIYKPMFQFFFVSYVPRTGSRIFNFPVARSRKKGRWLGIAAAACLLLSFGLKYTLNTQDTELKTSYTYIDGKKYTGIEFIREETLKSLESISEANDELLSSQIEVLELFFE